MHCLYDDQNRFCAAGANGTVVRGNENGFEELCSGSFDGALWSIEFFNGELVVAASSGLFAVREGKLIPFDKPAPAPHEGYHVKVIEDVLWSIGSEHVYR